MRLLLTLLTLAPLALPQQMDDEFAKSVKEWTTRPEFISPLVDHLPKSSGIPSPKDVLGYYIGAPNKLTYYSDIIRYYRALEAKSPRVKVINVGKTDEDRECVVVFVGSDESIKNLETYRKYLGQLADPRQITEAQARDIIGKAKPMYHIMGGLHSAETGPPEMLMELAYRLVTEDTPLIKKIRDNVIVSITPVAEPDGRDRYVDWYFRYKIHDTSEQDEAPGPPYWGKYIFHDNNRDINYSQMTMRTLLAWYLDWHPPIMHELHESEPFMYTFSGQSPQNPTLDPILYGELPWFSNFEMEQMTKYGMPGVWTHAFVDMWSPGYLGFMSSNHNGMMRMYEIFGNGGANTMHRRINGGRGGAPDTGGRGGRGGMTTREWYRPLPPYPETDWSARNNTNYEETGVLTALQLTSAFPDIILENFYKKTRNSIESGKKDKPYGYVIPANQPDMTRVATIVNILRLQGIEVGRASAEVKLREGTFPAGSFVIKRDQPYGRLAKILLEKQNFPDPSLTTYDDTAWTMGMMSNAKVVESDDLSVLNVPAPLIDKFEPRGTLPGSGSPYYAVLDNGSNNLVTLRYRLKDVAMKANEQSFKSGDQEIPAGSFIISGSEYARVKSAVEPLGLTAVALQAAPTAPAHDVNVPRLAVYSTWGSTQEVGWVRYAFDQYELKYDLIFKERVKQGNLRGAYDVIVIPNQGRGAKGLVYDIEPRPGKPPLAYTRTDQFKNLGMYGESEDITGGMGLEGVVELRKFVDAGGVMITLGTASSFPAEFGITRDVEAGRTSPQFYAPGPIVEAEIMHSSSPIFYGYTDKIIPVRWANGPLLTVPQRDREQQELMRFPGGDSSVMSGLMRGANEIRNRPAILDVPEGNGQVVMFATNPCYRWQNFGEFGMLFNAVMHYNDLKPR